MALIKCPECMGMVSNTAEACPHCGFAVKKWVEGNFDKQENYDLNEPKSYHNSIKDSYGDKEINESDDTNISKTSQSSTNLCNNSNQHNNQINSSLSISNSENSPMSTIFKDEGNSIDVDTDEKKAKKRFIMFLFPLILILVYILVISFGNKFTNNQYTINEGNLINYLTNEYGYDNIKKSIDEAISKSDSYSLSYSIIPTNVSEDDRKASVEVSLSITTSIVKDADRIIQSSDLSMSVLEELDTIYTNIKNSLEYAYFFNYGSDYYTLTVNISTPISFQVALDSNKIFYYYPGNASKLTYNDITLAERNLSIAENASTTSNSSEEEKPMIEFSDKSFHYDSKSNYAYYKATITNNTAYTLYYIKVKVKYKDDEHNVITSDWTYAVGSEGLDPGDSQEFELMTSISTRPKYSSISILDYQ